MQKIFDLLINSYIDNNVGIADSFLSDTLATQLTSNLISLYSRNLLFSAGIGSDKDFQQDKSVRGDRIYWLDRKHNDPFENSFFDQMDLFVSYLNRTCYTGITGYEFHYTLYEKGRFYKKHLDQFRNNENRQYSMIMYLNAGWQEKDGGQLCIHHDNYLQTIAPSIGKGILFKSSELEHEVLVTNKDRMSITGWLKIGT